MFDDNIMTSSFLQIVALLHICIGVLQLFMQIFCISLALNIYWQFRLGRNSKLLVLLDLAQTMVFNACPGGGFQLIIGAYMPLLLLVQ